MTKKEILILFLLVGLVTGLTLGYERQRPSGCCSVWFEKDVKGFPIPFVLTSPSANEGVTYLLALRLPGLQISLLGFVANISFWFLVLAGGWWVVKRIREW